MAQDEKLERANKRAKAAQASNPRAIAARYDRRSGRVEIHLSSDLVLSFSPQNVQGLEKARPSQLNEIEITPSGFGIYFPRLDADVYVPGLLDGVFGSKAWMASRLGQIGGRSSSRAKQAASRANGSLGGRPRKAIAH